MVRTCDNTFVTAVSMNPFWTFQFPPSYWRSNMEICVYIWVCNYAVQRLWNLVWKSQMSVGGGCFIVCKKQFMWSLKELLSTHCYCELHNPQFDASIA